MIFRWIKYNYFVKLIPYIVYQLVGVCELKIHFSLINLLIVIGVYGNSRDPIHDYISGDAFRSIAKYIYEENGSYGKNSGVKLDRRIFKNSPGDIVFVQIASLGAFLENIHPNIPNPYILITHNGDDIVDQRYLSFLLDPKIIRWYSQNVDIDHEKIVPIPIGIENRFWYFKRTDDDNLIAQINVKNVTRNALTYLNITPGTFQEERQYVLDFFQNRPFVNQLQSRDYKDYLLDLKSHTFCLSPSGNGLDCHRTWESLYLGCIPIVRPFVKPTMKLAVGNDSMYKDLPVIVVDHWSEVTADFLEEKFLEFREKKFDYSKLYFSYWKTMILKEANKVKNH